MVNGINTAQLTSALAPSNGSRYLENLSEISDSCDPHNKNFGKYTDKQIADATNKLNAREYAAFGHFAGDATPQGIAKLAEAYVNYMNQMSPEEQNGARYKGTKEGAIALLAGAKAMIADEKANPGKKTEKAKTLIEMMLDEMLKNLKKNGINVGASTNAVTSAGQVTFSAEALKLSAQV
jgi:hypothetical protein